MKIVVALAALASLGAEKGTGMRLQVSARNGRARLFPEQAAAFDIILRNEGKRPATVLAIDGNYATPMFRAYDPEGKILLAGAPGNRSTRVSRSAPEIRTVALAPGGELTTWVNLWGYGDPLGKGHYSFEAAHFLDAGGAKVVTSNRTPFEVVDGRVGSSALGYESSARIASILAWTVAPLEGGGSAELLVRLSDASSHVHVQQGAMSHGPVPPGARVAVSQLAPDGAGNWTGWVAVVAGGSVELVRHNMAHPLWRSGAAALPLRDPVAVPRFPDRGHAVFLATGAGPGGPALAGLVAPPGAPMGKVWSVPLRAQPTLSACAFMATGAISLLLVSQDGKETRLSRIDVDESGKVTAPERVVRTTGRRVLAVTADVRAGSPLSFLILEADQNRLALGTIPLVGEARFPEPTPLPGWPAVPAEVDLEVAMNGTVLLAVIDAQGNLYGGTPSDGLEPAGARVSQPRAVAIYKGVVYSGFTDKGYLFRPTR